LNGVYFIPLLGAILVGMFNKRVDGNSAFISIVVGLAIMIWGTFFSGDTIGNVFGSGYHFMGVVFVFLVVLQLVLGQKMKRSTPYVQADAKVVDLTPWKPARLVGGILVATVLIIYILLAKG